MRSAEPRIPHRKSRPVTGILLFDKPSGLSSNQALQRVRRLYAAAKGGHTGSLDPLATGLLPICLGEATKIAGLLLGAAKGYDTEARLGVTTDTDDAEGEVLVTRPVPSLDREVIEHALDGLRGAIMQRPPAYSALKRNGVPNYRRARRGETVDPAPRSVEVSRFDLLEATGDCLRLRIECGSGTYVRSLVRDLGERLGCGAHVTVLRRTWADPFREPRLFTLDELESAAAGGHGELDALLLPIEAGLSGQPSLSVEAEMALALRQGRGVQPPATDAGGRRIVLDEDGRVVALAEIGPDGLLRPLRVFNG